MLLYFNRQTAIIIAYRTAISAMTERLNGLGGFYRGRMEQQFGQSESSLINTFSQVVLATSTITGFLFLCCRLFDFIRLILSLFVLPGTPVWSSLPYPYLTFPLPLSAIFNTT